MRWVLLKDLSKTPKESRIRSGCLMYKIHIHLICQEVETSLSVWFILVKRRLRFWNLLRQGGLSSNEQSYPRHRKSGDRSRAGDQGDYRQCRIHVSRLFHRENTKEIETPCHGHDDWPHSRPQTHETTRSTRSKEGGPLVASWATRASFYSQEG